MPKKFYKDESRKEWNVELPEGKFIGHDRLTLGALLRIADATEKMAASYDEMKRSRDFWKERADYHQGIRDQQKRQIAGLRGQITKMKKRGRP